MEWMEELAQMTATIMLVCAWAGAALVVALDATARVLGWGVAGRLEPALRLAAAWTVGALALGSGMGTVEFWALPWG